MPNFKLLLKATLENIEYVEVASPDWFHFKVECGSCRTVSPKSIGVSTTETVEVGRATVNLAYTCPECKRAGSITIVKHSLKAVTVEQNEQWSQVVELECRGIEPVEPELFGTTWTATPTDGAAPFKDISLEDDWADYDTKNDCAVSILNPELKFEVSRGK